MSPGGALLRASRVFSLPPALPKPAMDANTTSVFHSDTATTPYPLLQAVTTPQSSLARGDWGLKRPLPLRATSRTSTPHLRIEAIDTYEHITDFKSASDHTITLKKWQELDLPLSTPHGVKKSIDKNYQGLLGNHQPLVSVFEEDMDRIEKQEASNIEDETVRWKYKGPWLAGMTEGEFDTYIHKQIRRRKLEFQTFLRSELALRWTDARTGAAREKGEEIPPPVKPADILPGELSKYIKDLRENKDYRNALICRFLDLPPIPPKPMIDPLNRSDFPIEDGKQSSATFESQSPSKNPFKSAGPPKTHPSAGLSYTRTSSILSNHPVFGPQANPSPVPARIVKPKSSGTDTGTAFIGVAGFTAEPPPGVSDFRSTGGKAAKLNKAVSNEMAHLQYVDLDTEGGAKSWVKPKSAYIDVDGRVRLFAELAHADAVAVKEGKTHEIPNVDEVKSSVSWTVPLNPQSQKTRIDFSSFKNRRTGGSVL